MHWASCPLLILQAWVRARAKAEVKGNCKGTLADTRRQAQSELVLISDLNESQHELDGVVPLLVLPVIKFAHGVKVLLIIELVQGVLICPLTDLTNIITINNAADITLIFKPLSSSMMTHSVSALISSMLRTPFYIP